MLRHLSIKDFAVVRQTELEFGPGMTVVSGETGAGKSLMVDALTLLAGARADWAAEWDFQVGCITDLGLMAR